MGEQHDIAGDFVQDRAGYTTDPVRNLRTNAVFAAEIDGTPDAVLLATELGEDYRNAILLHINSDTAAAGINAGDIVAFKLYGSTARCRIIKRRDSAASPQNDFWAIELTAGDT